MTTREQIEDEIRRLPEPLLQRVLDFVRALGNECDEAISTALLSESSLRKDWLAPEEDEAWRHL